MSRNFLVKALGAVVLAAVGGSVLWGQIEYQSGKKWDEPKVVTPGDHDSPPSDAVVLFDGKDLSKWKHGDRWKVVDGVATAQESDIETEQTFGDCQVHVEWATPAEVKSQGQGRGNSGVFLASRYELQVLDSFENPTYFDGQAGAIYKQRPPLVNACRKPGEWQTYDIVFTNPRFTDDGKLKTPGYITVLQNGVLVQNHTEIEGSTSYIQAPAYEAHELKQPLRLQFHHNPVRYRNIWIRELGDKSEK